MIYTYCNNIIIKYDTIYISDILPDYLYGYIMIVLILENVVILGKFTYRFYKYY